MRATIASIPTIPSMGRGHEIENNAGAGWSGTQFLRDKKGDLILDVNGNPIEVVGS